MHFLKPTLAVLLFAGFAVLFSCNSSKQFGVHNRPTTEIKSAMKDALLQMQSLSTEGGYLWRYAEDGSIRAGEKEATVSQIWVQDPGTPAMGTLFLDAYRVTNDEDYLVAAKHAALALVRGQLETGGWDYFIEFDSIERMRYRYRSDKPGTNKKARNRTTYDDDNTQSALRYLMNYLEVAPATGKHYDQISEALTYGLQKVLESQYPVGAWPQRWSGAPQPIDQYPITSARFPEEYPDTQPDGSYYGHYTFNDDTHRDLVRTLIKAWHFTSDSMYLNAAIKGADFLLLAQMPEPQPVWAQQYDRHMHPAWARAFEPPSVTAGESVNVIRFLMELYVEFNETKYLAPIEPGLDWFDRSKIGTNLWARLYELQTNRPVYGDRDKKIHYTLEEISAERKRGYSWQRDYHIDDLRKQYNDLTQISLEKWKAQYVNKPPLPSDDEDIESILAGLDEENRWITTRKIGRISDTVDTWIESRVYIRNMLKLLQYLEQQP